MRLGRQSNKLRSVICPSQFVSTAATLPHHNCAVRWFFATALPRAPSSPPDTPAVPAPTPASSPDRPVAALPVLREFFGKGSHGLVAQHFERNYDPATQPFLAYCGSACDARDVVLLLMRSYTALGRMEKVRTVFLIALRDLGAREEWTETPNTVVPPVALNAETGSSRIILTNDASLLPSHSNRPTSEPAASSLAKVIAWTRPSLLNASVFNGYLEVLTRRKNFDAAEGQYVLSEMKEAGVAPDALTYHYLCELHVRAGYDPKPLWYEMLHEEQGPLTPLPATVQLLLSRVVPSSPDAAFVVDVTRAALQCGAAVMDKRLMLELLEQWLRSTRTSLAVPGSTTTGAAAASSSASGSAAPAAATAQYPPEYVMWLLLELELRCVLDRVSLVPQFIQQTHMAELILRCARAGDTATCRHALAFMDRHGLGRTADVLALVVWCFAVAQLPEAALDVVESMARKGYLDLTDPFKRYHIECLRYAMDKHFLMVLADTVASAPSVWERVHTHLQEKRRLGRTVSVHSLDVLVLAAGKMGDERRAMHLVRSYESVWGLRPQTDTFNCLLVGCSANRGAAMHHMIYDNMKKAGVAPNGHTFRVLIRQAVLNDDIDSAVRYLQDVSQHANVRLEVEMLLPIFERAARAGDAETAHRVSDYALGFDIGIDGAVLQTAMRSLAEAGQSVEALKAHVPLHEALRSRSKAGRQRARSELVL